MDLEAFFLPFKALLDKASYSDGTCILNTLTNAYFQKPLHRLDAKFYNFTKKDFLSLYL